MEVQDVQRCCCVVSVAEAGSSKGPVSCSGVVVHPRTGTVICTGLPFVRFLLDKQTRSAQRRFLSPRCFSEKLRIHVTLCTQTRVESSQCSQGETVSLCSGGSSLQHEAAAELLMLVNCLEFEHTFHSLFQEADQWRFHGDDEDEELIRDAQFLSWFAVLKTDMAASSGVNPGFISWQSSSSLLKGCSVIACGSPFGSLCPDLFIGTISRGIISNLAGEDNAVILTDARCLPGTEGGGLFAMKAEDCLYFIGLVVSPFGWKKNEWIGLTLVCSVQMIFRNIICCMSTENPLRGVCPHVGESNLQMSTTADRSEAVPYPTVCFVDSGQVWGSGVVVTPELVVTCRHVVMGKSTVNLKFHHRERVLDIGGDVLFSTQITSPYDVAFVKLRGIVPDIVVPKIAQKFNSGESVLVVGYGGLGWRCGPSLTCGVLSNVVSLHHQPVMFQTTCAVQAGASGGAVVQTHSGELLGIVSSNTRDLSAKVTYPHLNFSIPLTLLQRSVDHFSQTGDVKVFKDLNTTDKKVRTVWRLQNAQSKL